MKTPSSIFSQMVSDNMMSVRESQAQKDEEVADQGRFVGYAYFMGSHPRNDTNLWAKRDENGKLMRSLMGYNGMRMG